MSFPTGQANGATTTLNGVVYIYNSTLNTWSKTTGASAPAQTVSALSVTGNLTVGGNLSVTGNSSLVIANINNGNTSVNLTPNSNVTISVAGNAGVLILTGSGANISGTANVSGNLSAANANITGTLNTASANVTGNITVGNILAGGYYYANGVAFSGGGGGGSGSSISNGTSNVNIGSSGSNVTVGVAGNANVLVVTGTGANISGTANITGTAFITTGNITTINSGLLQNGNSNIAITANGNVTVTSASNATMVITGTGANISGTANITGNTAVGGNLTVTGNLTVNGTTTSITSTTINVDDKNITVANNQTTGSGIDGAGLDAGNPAVATLRYNNSTTSWQSNVALTPSANGTLALGGTSNYWGNAYVSNIFSNGTLLQTQMYLNSIFF